MNARRAALLTSLLCAAALLYALPTLLGTLGGQQRVSERLLPARTRTLMVWLLSDEVSDSRTLGALLTAFEREHTGVRAYLRRATTSELRDGQTAPPDVALYAVGDVNDPESLFVPLALGDGAHSSGSSAGATYGAALWHEPMALCFPRGWLRADAAPDPSGDSFFQLQTPAPAEAVSPVVTVAELPWRELLAPGALERPQGAALQQLLFSCPEGLRGELIGVLGTGTAARAEPLPYKDEAGGGRDVGGTMIGVALPVQPQARVVTMREAISRAATDLICPLEPPVSMRARYASICRDGEDARALIRFLCSDAARDRALDDGLMPADPPKEVACPIRAAFCERYRAGTLMINAYAHTQQELLSLCLDAFLRGEPPAETLIRLR